MSESEPDSDSDVTIVKTITDKLVTELETIKNQEACLIIIQGDPQGNRHVLAKDTTTIGRDASADMALNDQKVSRLHSTVFKVGNDVTIRDEGSTNGTYVNGRKIDGPVLLRKEDMLKVGDTVLKYLPRGELEIYYIGMLESKAHTDALTQVFNRGYITEAMEAEFKRARALKQPFALMLLDLDHFKKINDTFGHDAGDMVLRETCQILKLSLKKSHILGRFGGEEFLTLLCATPIELALEIAEAARKSVETHEFIYEGKRISVTASIGLAAMTDTTENPTVLFKLADKALYVSKEQGRNRVSKQ